MKRGQTDRKTEARTSRLYERIGLRPDSMKILNVNINNFPKVDKGGEEGGKTLIHQQGIICTFFLPMPNFNILLQPLVQPKSKTTFKLATTFQYIIFLKKCHNS